MYYLSLQIHKLKTHKTTWKDTKQHKTTQKDTNQHKIIQKSIFANNILNNTKQDQINTN